MLTGCVLLAAAGCHEDGGSNGPKVGDWLSKNAGSAKSNNTSKSLLAKAPSPPKAVQPLQLKPSRGPSLLRPLELKPSRGPSVIKPLELKPSRGPSPLRPANTTVKPLDPKTTAAAQALEKDASERSKSNDSWWHSWFSKKEK